MAKEMLINTVEGQECRIAIVSDDKLDELYIERVSSASRVGNIYKGRVANVEPSIQAAFIDFGMNKNGFLHISDIHPRFFPEGGESSSEAVGRKRAHRERPPIQACLRRGQELVVQLTKEGIGTKGPTLTTYLSIPGRLLVLMPGMSKLGVSRKVEDEEARDKARELLSGLKLPQDAGFIVRTAGIDRPKKDLQRDLNYLSRLWQTIKQQAKSSRAPAEIYQESDLVIRTIRDIYNTDIHKIICDSRDEMKKVSDFIQAAMPRSKYNIELYEGKEGLFHDYGLEKEIEKIYSRRVELPSGGSLVIDQAEALVAIDVNSGKYRQGVDAEMTAMKTNQEAAGEIARQLRLRDLGGVIVIDFIDMRDERHRRAVEKTLRDAIKNDRAKTKVLKISAFGVVEMTRQRVRPSLKDSIYQQCPYCTGSGLIKSEESQSLALLRNLQRACCNDEIYKIQLNVTPKVAHYLLNSHRKQIADLETESGKKITIQASPDLGGDEVQIICTNNRDRAVAWEHPPKAKPSAAAPTNAKQPPAEHAPAVQEQAASTQAPAESVSTQPQPSIEPAAAHTSEPAAKEQLQQQPQQQTNREQGELKHKKSRRRGRRGGRKHRRKSHPAAQPAAPEIPPIA